MFWSSWKIGIDLVGIDLSLGWFFYLLRKGIELVNFFSGRGRREGVGILVRWVLGKVEGVGFFVLFFIY